MPMRRVRWLGTGCTDRVEHLLFSLAISVLPTSRVLDILRSSSDSHSLQIPLRGSSLHEKPECLIFRVLFATNAFGYRCGDY